MTHNLCSTLILNQLKSLFEANDKLLGEAELNKEKYNKLKFNARKSAFIAFGKFITATLGTDLAHYDNKLLKAPSKLDLNYDQLKEFCVKQAYNLSAYENELEFFDNKSYRINIIRSTHSAYMMIANKWVINQIDATAKSKPLHIGALFSYTEADINIVALKTALIDLASQDSQTSSALNAIDRVGAILHEQDLVPCWNKIFKLESDLSDEQCTIKSERLIQAIFGKMVSHHVYISENRDKLDATDIEYMENCISNLEHICLDLIPAITQSTTHDIYSKPSRRGTSAPKDLEPAEVS